MTRARLVAAAVITSAVWAFWPGPVLSHETVNTTVTFDREIVRILRKKCIACHSDHNLGMPLTTYEQTRPWSRSIEEEVLRRHMPPWRAVPGYGEFANDLSLTNRELQFLVGWIEGNGPKSKGQRLIVNIESVETPPGERLTLDVGAWQLGKPDLVKPLPPIAVVPGQPDGIARVVVDSGFTTDRWVRALEFKPSDRRVVRAAFFFVKESGQWLGSWTPWYGVTTLPATAAYRVPAGAQIVAEVHYRAASERVDEHGALGLYFTRRPAPDQPSDLVLQPTPASATDSPAGQKFHTSTVLLADTDILALRPELPPGARSLEIKATKPDGMSQELLMVKNILAEWPTPYVFKQPVRLPKGTALSVTIYVDTRAGAVPAHDLAIRIRRYDVAARTTTLARR